MELRSLFNRYKNVFALMNGEFGKTNKVKHCINTQGVEPVKHPGRRLLFHKGGERYVE